MSLAATATATAINLSAAIDYALNHAADGLEWLRAWNEGDPEAMTELDAWMASLD